MTCVNHPEVTATAFCRTCGKALCAACQVPALGTVLCSEHAPAEAKAAMQGAPPEPAPGTPWASVPPNPASDISPGLAFLLGLIPGVGAIYNAQYAKGLIHVVILGLLFSIVHSNAAGGLEPVFGILIPVFWFYMAFEAYHTAKRRQLGLPVDEFSSVFPVKPSNTGFPVGPVALIAVGILFLLMNLGVVRLYQLVRWWPVFLIVLGVYMLTSRLRTREPRFDSTIQEARNER